MFLHPAFEIGSGAHIKIPVTALQNVRIGETAHSFLLMRDTGFEPVTPTVSRYTSLLEANSFSVGNSIWSHANPCENEKCYSEMLQWFFASVP